MIVLVDFDNIPLALRNHGIYYIIDRIADRLGYACLADQSAKLKFRLYGGWYDNNRLSRRAQRIIPDVNRQFPCNLNIVDTTDRFTITVDVELAFSLLAEPSRHLFQTIRDREYPPGIRVKNPNSAGCVQASCPFEVLRHSLPIERCASPGCGVPMSSLLYRVEQKLVDTMLTADLIRLAANGERQVVLVTSDDDFWPGIRTATLLGTSIVQIHTRNRQTPASYSMGVGIAYDQRVL